MAENKTPPRGSTPIIADDTEVLSRRTSLGRGGVGEAAETAPEGNTSAAEDMGGTIPMATDGGGPDQSGPRPDIIPETHVAPESSEQPPLKEGCRCQNRPISGRGSRTVRLRIEGNRRQWAHDVYPGSGPLNGGNTLLPA